MRRRRPALPAAVVVAAFALAGCGITNPYNATTPPTATSPSQPYAGVTSTGADPAPERGGTMPRPAAATQTKLAAGAGEPTPQAAVARYARLYINWRASTVAAVQRELASISLDGARAQALQAAASYQHDTTLIMSHVANSGTVISIAAGQGPARGEWVLVTRETTTGQGDYQGLPAQLHITYAQLTRTPDGWIVTRWSPQT